MGGHRRAAAGIGAMLVAALAPAAAGRAAPPQRVMSINLCADALVLSLVPPQRIASVTYLSRSSSNAYEARLARRLPVNHGAAEEVLAQRPDLVIASVYGDPATRALLKRTGVRVLDLPPTNSFDDIRAVTRQVGRAVGEEARAEAMIARMDATLAELARTAPARRIRVAGWDGGGSVPGKGGLFDAILTAAGGENVAATMHGDRAATFDLEQLLAARPDMLAQGDAGVGAPSLRGAANGHPVLRRLYDGRRIVYPELLYSCGVPPVRRRRGSPCAPRCWRRHLQDTDDEARASVGGGGAAAASPCPAPASPSVADRRRGWPGGAGRGRPGRCARPRGRRSGRWSPRPSSGPGWRPSS